MGFKSRQDAIDKGTYEVKGPGRKRANPHLSTPCLEELVLEYLRNCIEECMDYSTGDGRKDALFTYFIRSIKKVCYYLVTKCAAVNMYKRGNRSEYLAAFAEAETSFLFSVKRFDVERLVESFVEYITIYYPTDKVETILNILREQSEVSLIFLQVQQENLRNRNKTTRKSIRKWVQNSEIFKALILKTLEVMEEPEFKESENIKHLIKTINHIIY